MEVVWRFLIQWSRLFFWLYFPSPEQVTVNRGWGNCKKISDQGLRHQCEGLRFSCNDRADEVNIFWLYGLFSAVHRKNAIKSNFQHPLARKPKDTVSLTMRQFLSLLPQERALARRASYTSPIAKSTSPGISGTTFFAGWSRVNLTSTRSLLTCWRSGKRTPDRSFGHYRKILPAEQPIRASVLL